MIAADSSDDRLEGRPELVDSVLELIARDRKRRLESQNVLVVTADADCERGPEPLSPLVSVVDGAILQFVDRRQRGGANDGLPPSRNGIAT